MFIKFMENRTLSITLLSCLIIVLFFLFHHYRVPPFKKINKQGIKFTGNGAWCWFQDPRSVYISGKRERSYAGWMTKDGKLQVGAYDHDAGEIEVVTIKKKWGINDHNTNSFLVLPDKRIMIFYTRHNGTGLFSRTTLKAEDISKWSDEIVVANTRRTTYSNPVYLSKEKRFYVFWRGESWKPTYSTSVDGITWDPPRILIQDTGREHPAIRPYFKLISDGVSEIHFAFTDGHPRDEPENSIYYIKYKNDKFFNANGTFVGTMDNLPIRHRQSDIVFDGRVNKVRAWVWDIALNVSGNPVITYTRLPDFDDHRYHYAYWDGANWIDNEISSAGGWFPQTKLHSKVMEPYYSGGIAINHANPSVVYLSREINNVFEIEKWITSDNGKNWISVSITSNSKSNNVRPVVPRGYGDNADHVLWMRGRYVHYTNYDTGIYMIAP